MLFLKIYQSIRMPNCIFIRLLSIKILLKFFCEKMDHNFLNGVKVVELAGLAPVPFCGMLLADFGAEVHLVINKCSDNSLAEVGQLMSRGKHKMELDFTSETDRKELRQLCRQSDVLLDPYRPGTLEAIGLDPAQLREENPGLIVARITGYGQTGPMAARAGHDINYVALSGLLPTIVGKSHRPTDEPPWPPANLLADFASGGLLAAFGLVASLFRRMQNCGRGCVLDCAMTEGLAYLGSFLFLSRDVPMLWREENALFSSQCPIYRTFGTADAKWMAVGALESKFRQKLFKILGIDEKHFVGPKELAKEMERIFRTKTRAEWTELFKGEDACVSPVLDLEEAANFEQHKARNAFRRLEGGFLSAEDAIGIWVPREVPRVMPDKRESKSNRSKL